jgi:hypothetical protein
MLALITLFAIWTSAMWLLRNSHMVDITSGANNVKDLLFVGSILTGTSLPINQEHALRLDAIQALKIRERGLLAEGSETLLLVFLSGRALCFSGVNARQSVLSSIAFETILILILDSSRDLALLGGLPWGLQSSVTIFPLGRTYQTILQWST